MNESLDQLSLNALRDVAFSNVWLEDIVTDDASETHSLRPHPLSYEGTFEGQPSHLMSSGSLLVHMNPLYNHKIIQILSYTYFIYNHWQKSCIDQHILFFNVFFLSNYFLCVSLSHTIWSLRSDPRCSLETCGDGYLRDHIFPHTGSQQVWLWTVPER